jgi:hypothetical protein
MSTKAKVLPITPDEAAKKWVRNLPDAVFEVFNKLLADEFDGESEVKSVIIRQDEVLTLLLEKGLDREQIFDKGWLNVEGAYQKAGWKVVYNKPGYNEEGPATFTFTRAAKR